VRSLLAMLLLPASLCLLRGDGTDKQPDRADKDYKDELPRIPPKEPAEALRAFRTRPGFRVELVAAEPLLSSPVAIDYDENGRLFVAEFTEYNQYANPKFKGRGRVRMLEDTDGDGRYDKSTIYVDNLDAPAAVACYDGGIFVAAVPDILYCKDSHGDGKADVRIKVFTGFDRDKAGEGMLNSFHWGLDNRLHISTSIAGGMVRLASQPNAKPVNVRNQNFVFDPRQALLPSADNVFELTSGGLQHGMSMDDWGRVFACGNSDPVHVMMYDRRYLARNPYLVAPAPAVNILPTGRTTKLFRVSAVEPWRALRTRLRTNKVVPGSDEGGSPAGFFTGATGVTIYRGDAWPAQYRGNGFVGEVSGNLVFRAELKPDGVGLVARRADAGVEFLASVDNWFRPVQFRNAPDGALHVIDMYRELIEGAAFLPPQILKHMDVSAGVDRGRIYRIVHEDHKRRAAPRLGKAATAELVALLENANGWHRDTASRLIYQRQDAAAVAPLRKLAAESKSPLGRLHALYALDGLKRLEETVLLRALDDAEPRVREHALRLAERFASSPAIRARLEQMVTDADLRVRYQLAFSLGQFPGDLPTRNLVTLAKSDGKDAWFRLAILSSSNGRAGNLFRLVLADRKLRDETHGKSLLEALAAQIGAAGKKDELAAVVQGLDGLTDAEKRLSQAIVQALVSRPSAAVRELGLDRSGKAGAILTDLIRDARRTAQDDKQEIAARVAAVRTLGLSRLADVKELFSELLHLRQPQPVQSAVLETLGRFDPREVSGLVLAAWPGLSPALRATAAETLFSQPAGVAAFLDAVESKKVGRGDVDPARLQLLQSHADPALKARAAKLLAATKLARRQEVVAAYQKALQLKGEAKRGKAIFVKDCSACHRLEGVGNEVGADLSAIRNRGNEAILLNILDPNREVLPKFLTYVLVTDAGRSLTGLIASETANSITIRRPDGASETVLRVNIDELRSTGLSFMPEGLEKQIDLQGMADLMAYLNSIR